MRLLSIVLSSVLFGSKVFSQQAVITGTIRDAISGDPLVGATVKLLKDSSLLKAVFADETGRYRIDNVSPGIYRLEAIHIGYDPFVSERVVVSGRQVVQLDILLEPRSQSLNTVTIKVKMEKIPVAGSSMIFDLEETERFAGSRGDPARMASTYAGVVINNDASNDLIVRGNSPLGVLWRLENVDIPNPNHFGVPGARGGPLSMIAPQILSNSVFYAGGFPPRFGNSVAAVFDLAMRRGNSERHQFQGEFGFLGVRALAEGPINRGKGASYLMNYRYSTVAIFHLLGIDIGTDAVPQYQDLAFKIHFPIKSRASLSLWGIGGTSKIDIIKSNKTDPNDIDLYGAIDLDEYYRTRAGITGIKLTLPGGKNGKIEADLVASNEMQQNHQLRIYRTVLADTVIVDSLKSYLLYRFNYDRIASYLRWNKRLSNSLSLFIGGDASLFLANLYDSIYRDYLNGFEVRQVYSGKFWLTKHYAELHWKRNKTKIVGGLHSMFFSLSKKTSLEPRLSIQHELTQNISGHISTGIYAQTIPFYIYTARTLTDSGYYYLNTNVDFMKSAHFITGVKGNKGPWKFIIEAYYQHLFDVPVEEKPSSYSIVNEGYDLNRFWPNKLVNKGIARNMGIDIALEYFFHKGIYTLSAVSLYDSKYRGSDGNWYNTVYNGRFAFKQVIAWEKTFSKGKTTYTPMIGLRFTVLGNKRYSPIDTVQSLAKGEIVYVDSLAYTLQLPSYKRFDIKLRVRIDKSKVGHEIGLDLVNVFGWKNVFTIVYTGGDPPLRYSYQLGFMPIFYYRIYL